MEHWQSSRPHGSGTGAPQSEVETIKKMSRDVDRSSPTLATVATLAGVSPITVSRVINGAPNVTPATKAKVERAIKKTGYVAHHAARSLVTRRTNSVAFVVSESQHQFFNDPVFGAIMMGANSRLGADNFQLVSIVCTTDADRVRVSEYIRAGHVDGALLASFRRDDSLLRALHDAQVPLVMSGRPPRSMPIPYVDVDNKSAAEIAVRHLIDVGCTRIATIAGPVRMSSGMHRLKGYRDALGHKDELVAQGDYTRASGQRAMTELLERCSDIDGVFAASDAMAAGAMEALRAAGRRIPDDVRVAGFDDSAIATEVEPNLTTVRQPLEEIGQNMADLLVRRLVGETTPRSVILPTTLIRRAST